MSNENALGRINAIMEAAETVINHPRADKDTQIMAKEVAYVAILEIIKEWNKGKEP